MASKRLISSDNNSNNPYSYRMPWSAKSCYQSRSCQNLKLKYSDNEVRVITGLRNNNKSLNIPVNFITLSFVNRQRFFSLQYF